MGSAEIFMGHEMGHAVRDELGIRIKDPNNKINGINLEEIYNVKQIENRLRVIFRNKQLDVNGEVLFPLQREFYGGRRIPDINVKSIEEVYQNAE